MQAPQALALPELAHRREHGGVAARELRHPRQLHPHLENYFVGAESSGGQLNRLLLAKVVLEDSNLLMLDEPTNDLDMESCDVLTYLFTMLCGTVIMLAAKNGTQQICVLGAFGPDLFVGHKIGETRKKMCARCFKGALSNQGQNLVRFKKEEEKTRPKGWLILLRRTVALLSGGVKGKSKGRLPVCDVVKETNTNLTI